VDPKHPQYFAFDSGRFYYPIGQNVSWLPLPAWLFANCFPNTLDTTVFFDPDGPDTFVITEDILAMWLRDSSAQLWPYLPFIQDDPELDRLFQGAIKRQVHCILLDPYANAFYQKHRESPWHTDKTEMHPGIHERKWELDSLAYFLRLSCSCGSR